MTSKKEDKNIEKKKPKIESIANFPEGHIAMVVSFPLPKNHWIFQEHKEPPAPLDMVSIEERMLLESKFKDVIKYAVRATIGSKDMDFDPDAMIQNFMVGMFGYYKNFPRDTIKIRKEFEGRPLIDVVLSRVKELENNKLIQERQKMIEIIEKRIEELNRKRIEVTNASHLDKELLQKIYERIYELQDLKKKVERE